MITALELFYALGTLLVYLYLTNFARRAMKRRALIWDLGNTLIKADAWTFAKEIGITDFTLYALLDWKNPFKIYEDAFALLRHLDIHFEEPHPGATARGELLPGLMCSWLAGKIDPASIKDTIEDCVSRLANEGYFKSSRHEQLTRRTLEVLFNPVLFARCMKPIKQGVDLLTFCAEQTNPDGTLRNELYILSNWDAFSFKQMMSSPILAQVFAPFKPEHIMISGAVGAIKPQPQIYTLFLEQFELKPEQCIMIDDQPENLCPAQECGMVGILLEQRNYTAVTKRLEALRVIG
jgi:FMN phosphatase YigB (HAD superfamily)